MAIRYLQLAILQSPENTQMAEAVKWLLKGGGGLFSSIFIFWYATLTINHLYVSRLVFSQSGDG